MTSDSEQDLTNGSSRCRRHKVSTYAGARRTDTTGSDERGCSDRQELAPTTSRRDARPAPAGDSADASVVVIPGPQADLSAEIEKVKSYLEKGGS